MHAPARLLLNGWSQRTKLYPDISKVSSSGDLLELRCLRKTNNVELVKYKICSQERQFNVIVSKQNVQVPVVY